MKNISIKPKLPPYYPLKCFYVDGNQLIASSGYTNQHVINLERIINNSSGHIDLKFNSNYDNKINEITIEGTSCLTYISHNQVICEEYLFCDNYYIIADMNKIVILYDRRKNKNKAIVSMDEIPIKQPWEK